MTLPAYKITYSNGRTLITSMAPHITLEDAKAYFIGRHWDLGYYPKEEMVKAVKVEEVTL